ncbi:hypothetical protein PPTG_24025 [Phytophthora nicotianae INRA-310]|uniref:Uncharacterized protein n=1 Tax=Phytophthora nicotianae (strain INRA-310) TaxID=761204 RepID=W2PM40_PHYN3|nr:hypothetical protein PPTG_24025 [Phytophthora nicotianae INRA-310]ETN01696.1 hypothetical protein PPTG_24025 [Phytophthora nicotianae INRA-310]
MLPRCDAGAEECQKVVTSAHKRRRVATPHKGRRDVLCGLGVSPKTGTDVLLGGTEPLLEGASVLERVSLKAYSVRVQHLHGRRHLSGLDERRTSLPSSEVERDHGRVRSC